MKPTTNTNIADEPLFQSRLSQIIDLRHPLVQLAQALDWKALEDKVAPLYCAGNGRPGLSPRLMVGLNYLKYAFNESDESVVARWIENPYWQYFCGMEFMQHELPIDPSSMTRWRDRVGPEMFDLMQAQVLKAAVALGQVKASAFETVAIDSTVQEKAIAYPTDARLCHKARRILVSLAKKAEIPLRQSYVRVSKEALRRYGGYAHARQFKRARREKRKLKTWLGRVIRDITKKGGDKIQGKLAVMLERAKRIHTQQPKDKNKLYAMHAPEVVCMSKGKAHKPYEFGSKVGFATSVQGNWVLSAIAFTGNPYDGHTLMTNVVHAKMITGVPVKQVVADKGYRGHGCKALAQVLISGTRGLPKKLKKMLNRRQSIEPVIGHMKHGHRLDRCHLKGQMGDHLNAMGAGIGFNLLKVLGGIFLPLWIWLQCAIKNQNPRLAVAMVGG
jgi:transposase, IS5 family